MKVISFASAQNIGRISSALRSRLPLSSSTSSVADTFTKHDKFVPFNKIYPREITPQWFASLSADDLNRYERELESYKPYLNIGELRRFDEYSKYLQDGLDKLSQGKEHKFISIGQSPAFFAKIMQVKGQDAGICPISELGKLGAIFSLDSVLKNSDKYFEYLKKFNVDLENIDKNKNYFFSDFAVSGDSLRNFRELLKAKGIVGDNIRVMPMDSIVAQANIPFEKRPDIVQMDNYYLYMQNLKNRYSPIFKLPVNRLNEIEDVERCYLGCPTNNAANVMLYWLLKNKKCK